MDDAAQRPAYIDKVLAGAARTAGDLYLHLGYWPEPARAGTEHAELLAAQRRLDDELRAMADLRDGLAVLDVGCGIGGTLAAIDAEHGGMRLTGLNVDAAQLDVARARVTPRGPSTIDWVLGDACALPFDDASYDRVLAFECAFHFASRRRFLAEAARVLRPGGRLVASDFVASPAMRALRDGGAFPGFAIEAAIVPALGPWPDFWADDADHDALASAAGLSIALRRDASRATLPSYRCFLRGACDLDAPGPAASLDPVDRGLVVLEWLQRRGMLRMELLAFVR